MSEEEKYIARCIQLAKNGMNNVAPNPMVGAVIVCNGKIIGEGYHVYYGGPHAEVNAIRSVIDQSMLKKSTIFVSLEPCSHHGKTPPCADLIIEKGIPNVVVGCTDPFSIVAGRGIQKLKEAGIKVVTGILETECKSLIKRFTTLNTLQRPYIILKWAESADGFMDINRGSGKPYILSNPLTQMLVHKKRAESDAIIIGTRTALLDNPSLTVRSWYGNNPVRIVLDKNLSLPANLHIFNDGYPTIVLTSKENNAKSGNVEYIQLNYTKDILPQILSILYKRKIQTLLVEGGSTLLQSFISSYLWDEAYIEKTQIKLNSGIKSPHINNMYGISCKVLFGNEIHHVIR